MIKRISHIAIVVPDLEEALNFWAGTLGLEVSHMEYVEDQGVDVAIMPSGESEVELLEPRDDTSGVARFMANRGPGIHHICFEVDDIEETLQQLKEAGVPLINDEPTIGTGGKRIAFIHPKGANGVLVELYQVTAREGERRSARLKAMRERIAAESRIYAAGAASFFARLRADTADS